MSCRVGMATKSRLEARIQYWMEKEGHTHSEILHEGLNYKEAQIMEEVEAEARGCKHKLGGEDVEGAFWSVYHVWGGD